MEEKTVGFAMCGSFCTHARAMAALEQVRARWRNVIPIVSECTAATDTRFGNAHDLLIICPCTGNTLGKLAAGVTDSSVTMAAKAHLRNGRPLLIAPSTNDGLSASAAAIGALLARKYIYFVPFGQDDPLHKPTSLVADFTLVPAAAQAALEGYQLQPLLTTP